MFYHWMAASLAVRLIEFILFVAAYEIVRYLVINKIRQIGANIKARFTRKK